MGFESNHVKQFGMKILSASFSESQEMAHLIVSSMLMEGEIIWGSL
uniref:Uncharacterized protein n=1 Tax=Vitis vinifera TaxID=29760 RepID=F6H495_VITVI